MAPQGIGRGLFLQASALTVVLGVCNVAACFLLVDAYGMKGAALSLLGVSAVSVVANGVMAVWVQRRAASELQSAPDDLQPERRAAPTVECVEDAPDQ